MPQIHRRRRKNALQNRLAKKLKKINWNVHVSLKRRFIPVKSSEMKQLADCTKPQQVTTTYFLQNVQFFVVLQVSLRRSSSGEPPSGAAVTGV